MVKYQILLQNLHIEVHCTLKAFSMFALPKILHIIVSHLLLDLLSDIWFAK